MVSLLLGCWGIQPLSVLKRSSAILWGIVLFMIIDTGAYTIGRVGIISTTGYWRIVCGCLLLALCAHCYKILPQTPSIAFQRLALAMFLGVVLVGTALFVSQAKQRITPILEFPELSAQSLTKTLPHILFIATDGLNASRMSAYGYQNDTTPFIRSVLDQALVIDNAYPNSQRSPSSIAALLTGKLPTSTRLIYTPDILRGAHSFQHLPGILKGIGYQTASLTVRGVIDPYEWNMLNSFDQANRRSRAGFQAFIEQASEYGFFEEAYFVFSVYERLEDRLLHSFLGREMIDFQGDVLGFSERRYSDQTQVDSLFDILDSATSPVFVHLHLMGTHGRLFFPKEKVFSHGLEQSAVWMKEFYEDAIRDFDQQFEQIVRYLKEENQLQNTLIVLMSDHGINSTFARTPLVFFFPKQEHVGHLKGNIQHIDIAPTILDFLRLKIPSWMEGKSLLQMPMPLDRPVMYVAEVDEGVSKPPFGNLSALGMVICNRGYELTLTSGAEAIRSFTTEGEAGCRVDLSADKAKTLMVSHLREKGYRF